MTYFLLRYAGKRLGAALAAWDVILLSIVLLLVYYEGIGPIRELRYVGTAITYVPLIGDIIEGEIPRRVEKATAGLVAEAELAAARAQLAEERRRTLAASQATTEATKRAEAALKAKDEALADLDLRIEQDNPDGNRAVLTEEDIQWLDAR